MPKDRPTQECEFSWGDRIDHPKFGFGTISSNPKRLTGPNSDYSKTEGRGWSFTVDWEDPHREPASLKSKFVSLIETKDAKGSKYWIHQHNILLKQAQEDVFKFQNILKNSYQPRGENKTNALKLALENVQTSTQEIFKFLADEETGLHL